MTARRLDEELVARGYLRSRSRARDAVLRGTVAVNGRTTRKPAQVVTASDNITVNDAARNYVSRAALKLMHGLDHFHINVAGRHCLDIGASTGGFTQVLLERGAVHVTAIDVGHGQMAQALATDPRVRSIEGLNARDISEQHLPAGLSLITCDVSFIPLKLALAPSLRLAPLGCALLMLIKPQYEVGKDHLGKNGVVTDPRLHRRACDDAVKFLSDAGWETKGLTAVPLAGGDGNREFLAYALKR